MNRRLPFIVLLIAISFIAALVLSGRLRLVTGTAAATEPRATTEAAPATATRAAVPTEAQAAPAPVVVGGPDFTKVAGQSIKGVANISSLQVVQRPRTPFGEDPFFSYFFGDQDIFGPRTRQSLSLGSGVVVSADGYIVTNNHVVGENVREITVGLADKRELRGTVIGVDPATDIALLKIDTTGLPVVPWGDSSKLQVGEWVLAIGSPFQLSQTVTAGIVSATGRANLNFAQYEDFIQTDAAINPGNSGGALINSRGDLVGINTGIYSKNGGYEGIGFAVPSNLAQRIVNDLKQYGAVQRGVIDTVRFEPLTPGLATQIAATGVPAGAVVISMQRNSRAFEAGLQPGDVVVGINGHEVSGPSDLYRAVADLKIGTTATLKIVRYGRPVELKIPIVAEARGRR